MEESKSKETISLTKKYTVIREWTLEGKDCMIRPYQERDAEYDGYEDTGYDRSVEIDCYSNLELAIKSSCFNPNFINFSGFNEEQTKEKEEIFNRLFKDKEYMKN